MRSRCSLKAFHGALDSHTARFCFLKNCFVILILFMTSAALAAQGPPRTSPVSGAVVDPSGAATPDAIVTLKQASGKQIAVVRTGPTGKFQFNAVPPGDYLIQVRHEGFQTAVVPLKISIRQIQPLKIELALEELVSQVSVSEAETAQVSTEISENRNAASADQEILEKVPVFDQDYVAAMSAFLDAGAFGANGPEMIVNGVEVSSVIASPSTIQEVRINQNPYSAEFARPGRGAIEIITKDPTAAYHGTLNFIFRDSVFNARDPFALVRPPEQRRIWEGALGGPVGHSKSTSFLISGHRQEEDIQSTIFAQGLDGPIQKTVPSPRRDTQLSVRVSHQFGASHTGSVQYNEWDYPRYNQGVGNFVLPEAATDSFEWERELIFADRFEPSPQWLLQSQILLGVERHFRTSVSSAPQIVVQDAFTSGGAQIDYLQTEYHTQMNEIVSWSSGKHYVKFGINVPDWSRRGIEDRNNFGGTYYFDSLQNYAAQIPYAFKQQQGSGKTVFVQKELGAFVQDEYKLKPNLSISLGLRYNWQNFLDDYTQFAPRLAFAYSPDKERKTVFRGGAGIFFDRTGPRPLFSLHLYDGQVLQSLLVIDPSYPDPFANLPEIPPSDIVRFAPNLREPYSIQYSFGVERQLSKRATIAVTYSGSRGIRLFRSRDINAPLPPDYLTVPDPTLGFVTQIESAGRQTGNSLEITVRGQLTHRLTGIIQYTLSRTENNTGGINWFPANQYDLSGEWGRADFDHRHRLNLLESFDAGKSFTVGVRLSVSSGAPETLTTGQDEFHTGLNNARPEGVGRNTLEGPGYMGLDLRVSRDFFLSKDKKDKGKVLTFALDAFNLPNHVNYDYFVSNISSPFFGHAVSAVAPRRLQLTTRFKF